MFYCSQPKCLNRLQNSAQPAWLETNFVTVPFFPLFCIKINDFLQVFASGKTWNVPVLSGKLTWLPWSASPESPSSIPQNRDNISLSRPSREFQWLTKMGLNYHSLEKIVEWGEFYSKEKLFIKDCFVLLQKPIWKQIQWPRVNCLTPRTRNL